MLTTKRAFEGELISDVLASVLTTDPDWKVLGSEMRATAFGPNPPGVTCPGWIGIATQKAVRSSGKRKAGFMMPITARFCPARL